MLIGFDTARPLRLFSKKNRKRKRKKYISIIMKAIKIKKQYKKKKTSKIKKQNKTKKTIIIKKNYCCILF